MDPKTQAYVARKTAEGDSKLEITRCLKRYLAREIYHLLNPGQQDIACRPYRCKAARLDIQPALPPPPRTLQMILPGVVGRCIPS